MGILFIPHLHPVKQSIWHIDMPRKQVNVSFMDFYAYRSPEYDVFAENFSDKTGYGYLGWWESEESNWGCCNKDMIREYLKNNNVNKL